jgi:hypothetical protein
MENLTYLHRFRQRLILRLLLNDLTNHFSYRVKKTMLSKCDAE